MKVMQKEREKRYWSAKAFANDIERFLRGEPTLATKISTISRIIRGLKKRKMTLIIILLFLIAFSTSALIMLIERARFTARQRQASNLLLQAVKLIDEFDRKLLLAPFNLAKEFHLLDKAIEKARQAIDKGNLSQGYYEIARALRRKGDFKGARRSIEKAILSEDNPFYRYERALINMKIYEGSAFYKKLTKKELKELKSLILQDAKIAADSGEFTPNQTEYLIAFFEYFGDRLDKSLKILKNLEDRLGEGDEKLLPEVLFLQCSIYVRLKRYDKIIEVCKKGYNIRRSDLRFYLNCASAHLKRAQKKIINGFDPEDDFSMALACLKKAEKINRYNPIIHFNKGNIHKTKADYLFQKGGDPSRQINMAIKAFKRVIELFSDAPLAWSSLGMTYFLKAQYMIKNDQDPSEEFKLAIDALKKVIDLEPDSVSSYIQINTVISSRFMHLWLKGMDPTADVELALKYNNKAIKLTPDDENLYYNQAFLFFSKAEYLKKIKKQSKRWYSKVIKMVDKGMRLSRQKKRKIPAIGYYHRGISYFRIKMYKEAIEDMEKAIRLNPPYRSLLLPLIKQAQDELK
jgi:tetratricopeptide (TPR) repeat protein